MKTKSLRLFKCLCATAALLLASLHASAQWQTQSFTSKLGWNAVFLHVDASHDSIEAQVPIDIQELWLWKPNLSTLQFITSPQEPTDGGSQWLVWKRGIPSESTLVSLIGNAAYLVYNASVGDVNWSLKGKPVPPRQIWTTSGVNFIGYSSPSVSPPNFENFLLKGGSALLTDLEHYQYIGGPLENNPRKILALRNEPVTRGRAYWARSKSGSFNRYFGAFEASLQKADGVNYGESLSTYRIRLRNLTSEPITVTLDHLASETPPAGETAIVGRPPLLLRGELDIANLTFAFSQLNAGPQTFDLAPAGETESSIEVVIGLDRADMGGSPGDLFAGILRFTDSLGFTRIDVPSSADRAALSGLWVGDAKLSQVRHNLSYFARNPAGDILFNENGSPTVTSNNVTLGATQRSFPLRLIVHVDENGVSRLLQRVYVGINAELESQISVNETLIAPQYLFRARRISATHLPWSKANAPWTLAGAFDRGQTLAALVNTPHGDQAANPFLHTFHPDHDNRNATFDQYLARGVESYDINRNVSLTIANPANTFNALTSGHRTLMGIYTETMTLRGKGSEAKEYAAQGEFTLNRISTNPVIATGAP